MKIGYVINWILTRKCDLKCSYCGIIKNKDVYKKTPFYNDIDLDKICSFLKRMSIHNPDLFNIFYGGEPTMWEPLPDLIKFCNKNKINYTIVTNMSTRSSKKVDELLDICGYLNGLSFTVDPVLFDENFSKDDDRYIKSKRAFENIEKYSKDNRVRELVAEVVADNNNLKYMDKLCESLTEKGVWTDFTVIEVPLNKYYDFASSNIDYDLVVKSTQENITYLMNLYERAERGQLKIIAHKVIKHYLVPNLPQHYNCNIEKNLSIISIDSDSSVRLCYRIKGVETQNVSVYELLKDDGSLRDIVVNYLMDCMKNDKRNYCYGCAWTCAMFGDLINSKIIDPTNITHNY